MAERRIEPGTNRVQYRAKPVPGRGRRFADGAGNTAHAVRSAGFERTTALVTDAGEHCVVQGVGWRVADLIVFVVSDYAIASKLASTGITARHRSRERQITLWERACSR